MKTMWQSASYNHDKCVVKIPIKTLIESCSHTLRCHHDNVMSFISCSLQWWRDICQLPSKWVVKVGPKELFFFSFFAQVFYEAELYKSKFRVKSAADITARCWSQKCLFESTLQNTITGKVGWESDRHSFTLPPINGFLHRAQRSLLTWWLTHWYKLCAVCVCLGLYRSTASATLMLLL